MDPMTPRDAAPTKTILVVDDSLVIRRSVANALGAVGFDVVEAANGVDALELFKSRPIALVVTDISMPRMNGAELIGCIRDHETRANVPVIVLSTHMAGYNEAAGADLGPQTLWLRKPFKAPMLLAAVATLLSPDAEAGASEALGAGS